MRSGAELKFLAITVMAVSISAAAQTAPKQGEKGPQVRYNYLNVCAPGDDAKH